MEARDRRANLALIGAAVIAWLGVAAVILSLDPRTDLSIGYLGAAVIGLAVGLTSAPLFWLVSFARQRRIAYRGDWGRALRRGAWTAGLVAVAVLLRVEGLFQLPIVLFLVALVVVAEITVSARG